MHSNDFCINHPNRLLLKIRCNEADSVYVTEGLIKTYPVSQLVSAFKTWFKKNVEKQFQDIKFSDIIDKHWATQEIDRHHDERLADIVDESYMFDGDQRLITFYIPFSD